MKLYSFAFAVLILFQQQSCDMGGPQAKQELENGFRPYFPNAVVVLTPDRNWIQVFTCSTGVGNQLITEVSNTFVQSGKYASLRDGMQTAAAFSIIGRALSGQKAVSYRYFDIGFENGMLRFDLTANTNQWLVATSPYHGEYLLRCNSQHQGNLQSTPGNDYLP